MSDWRGVSADGSRLVSRDIVEVESPLCRAPVLFFTDDEHIISRSADGHFGGVFARHDGIQIHMSTLIANDESSMKEIDKGKVRLAGEGGE